MLRRFLGLAGFAVVSSALALAADGCGGDDDATPGGDASVESAPGTDSGPGAPDAAPDVVKDAADAGSDASTSFACTGGVVVPDAGETCTGFGSGTPCDTCTPAGYGYVCFGGGPPNFAGCVRVRASAFGDTFCCPKNECVAEPDQDNKCNGVAGKPHRYQCPPKGNDAGFVTPPADCVEKSTGGDPYPYYCCP